MKPCPLVERWKLVETAALSPLLQKKMTQMGWVHMHPTSKRVELKIPADNDKPEVPPRDGAMKMQKLFQALPY